MISELGDRTFDVAFIDGIHQIEFALRDLINVEKLLLRGVRYPDPRRATRSMR